MRKDGLSITFRPDLDHYMLEKDMVVFKWVNHMNHDCLCIEDIEALLKPDDVEVSNDGEYTLTWYYDD